MEVITPDGVASVNTKMCMLGFVLPVWCKLLQVTGAKKPARGGLASDISGLPAAISSSHWFQCFTDSVYGGGHESGIISEVLNLFPFD
jgi:hypothetical protein